MKKTYKVLLAVLLSILSLIIILIPSMVLAYSFSGIRGYSSLGNESGSISIGNYLGDVTIGEDTSGLPTTTTNSAANITTSGATLQATVNSLGSYSPVYASFQYGTTPSYGSSTVEQNITSAIAYNQAITGLSANTTYHFRAKVRYGTVEYVTGNDVTFTTATLGAPTVITDTTINITTTTATLQGTLTSLGNETTVYSYFEYGTSVAYGSQTTDQTKTTIGSYNANITGLSSNTTYHVRAVTRYNTASYVYGSDSTFTTLSSGAPQIPTNFVVSSYTSTSISLSWTKGNGATNTLVRWSTTGYPTSPTEGTQLYSGTGTSTTHGTLTTDTRYYYSAWSETGGLYSVTYTTISGVPTNDLLPIPDIFNIESVQIFKGYITGQTEDQLIVYSIKIIWNDGMPTNYNPSDFFYIQILDGANIIKQDRIKMWGYVPGSLYISASTALEWNKAYTFRLIGTSNYSTPPTATYDITQSNYIGNDYDYLSTWVRDLATRMEQSPYWTNPLLETSGSTVILTSSGSQIFNTAIPGLSNRCSDLFTPTSIPIPEPATTPKASMDYSQKLLEDAEDNNGTVLWGGYTVIGDMIDVEPDKVGLFIWFVIYLIAVIVCTYLGVAFVSSLLVCSPIIFGMGQIGILGMDMTIGILIVLALVWVFREIFRSA